MKGVTPIWETLYVYIYIYTYIYTDNIMNYMLGQRSKKYGYGNSKSYVTITFGKTLAIIHPICSVPRSIEVQSD